MATPESIAIVGAGVSGLTCGVALAERGFRISILARETGQQTTSSVAAAIWFPYDAAPADKVIPWALQTYHWLKDLAGQPATGVSLIELRTFGRRLEIEIPEWAHQLGARRLNENEILSDFVGGFRLSIPLTDTTIYLGYLQARFRRAGGRVVENTDLARLEDIDRVHELVINCAGLGAARLVQDANLEPHRGQVVLVQKFDGLTNAVVCDDPPLMYAVPRANDCLFGGTNQLSDRREVDPADTEHILAECNRVLGRASSEVVAARVGLRPFRKAGVRLERGKLEDGRPVVHNYGHGGSGFTLSWGCAQEVLALVESE